MGCDRDGACLEYNIKTLPMALFGMCLAIKSLTFVFLILTYLVNRARVSKSLNEPQASGNKSGVPVSVSSDNQITTVSYMSNCDNETAA